MNNDFYFYLMLILFVLTLSVTIYYRTIRKKSMTIQELREKLQKFPKYPGAKNYPPASVCNDGFPSCFNLSMSEAEMHELWGQYLKYDADLIYSKIQPCIRHQDWQTILEDKENNYRYLSLFDMSDVGGLIIQKDNSKHQESTEFSINSMINFLKSLNLDMKKLRIAYFEETNIKLATDGKYNLDQNFPTDPMLPYWKESFGFSESQFIPNHNRDTMLALNIFGNPTPWGYRNEIFYEHKGKLLDIGTVEHLAQVPVFNEKNEVVDVKPFEHSVAISAVGIQRIAMIVNDLENAWDVDNIKPMVEKAKELFGTSDHEAMVITQSLRVIHRIITDGKNYNQLNDRRKEYFRKFLKPLLSNLKNEADFEKIQTLLEMHANLESSYPELENSTRQTLEEIKQRKIAIESDKSIKHRGVAQQ